MTRLAGIAALALFLSAVPAHAQVSGGLDGKWHHHVIHLLGDDGLRVPIADLWAAADAPRVAFRARAALAPADLDRPLLVERGTTTAPPHTATLRTPAAGLVTTPTESGPAHLFARDGDGIADTLLQLTLPAGCHTACAIEDITLTQLPGATLTLAAPAPARVLVPVDRYPIEPGDRRLKLL